MLGSTIPLVDEQDSHESRENDYGCVSVWKDTVRTKVDIRMGWVEMDARYRTWYLRDPGLAVTDGAVGRNRARDCG